MNAKILPAVLLVLSSAALSNLAQADPLSLQTEILRLQAQTIIPGVTALAYDSYLFSLPGSVIRMPLDADLSLITTDLGAEALAGLLSEPAGAVEKPMLRAPEPSSAFLFVAGMVAFAVLGLGRRFLPSAHRVLRKRTRTPYRMMA